MRRTSLRFMLAALVATIASAPHAQGAETKQTLNGIGLIDYSHKPSFKVGDWARYHMVSDSELGAHDDYVVTVLIGGEEEWWGEDCFWVETWTDEPDRAPETNCTLMSYAIFDDSLAVPHLQLYMRKTITGVDDNGNPAIDLYRRTASSLKSRSLPEDKVHWDTDTAGVDTVVTPAGAFHTSKIVLKQGTAATTSVGDSSLYTEVREDRTLWVDHKIPVTCLAREDIDTSMKRRTWAIGHSSESTALHTMDRALGSARLVAYGHGLEARLVPHDLRKSLAQQRAAARPKPKSAPGAKSAGGKSSG